MNAPSATTALPTMPAPSAGFRRIRRPRAIALNRRSRRFRAMRVTIQPTSAFRFREHVHVRAGYPWPTPQSAVAAPPLTGLAPLLPWLTDVVTGAPGLERRRAREDSLPRSWSPRPPGRPPASHSAGSNASPATQVTGRAAFAAVALFELRPRGRAARKRRGFRRMGRSGLAMAVFLAISSGYVPPRPELHDTSRTSSSCRRRRR